MGMTEAKIGKGPNQKSLQRDLPDISIAFKATQKRLLSQKTNTSNQEIESNNQSQQKENINRRTERYQQQQQPSNKNTQMQKNMIGQEPQQQFQGQIHLQEQNDSDPSFYSIKQQEIEQNVPPQNYQHRQPDQKEDYKQKIVPKQFLNQQEHPKFQQIQQPQPQQHTPVQSMQQNQFDQFQQNDLLLHIQPDFNINQSSMQQNQHDEGKLNQLELPIQSNFNFNQMQQDQDKQNEIFQPLQQNFKISENLLVLEQNQQIISDNRRNKSKQDNNGQPKDEEEQVINFDNQFDNEEIDESPNINNMQKFQSSYNARAGGNLKNRNSDLMSEDASQIIEQKCFICSHSMQQNYLMLTCQHQIHKNCALKTLKNNKCFYHCTCGALISNHLFE